MQEIRDSQKLETYLNQFHIRELFDTRDLPFRLYRYEVGEMLNGRIRANDILGLSQDGTLQLLLAQADTSDLQFILPRFASLDIEVSVIH